MIKKKNNHLQQSIFYFEQGQFLLADKLVSEFLMSNPFNFDALYLKGIVCGIQFKHEECSYYLLRALKINSKHGFLQFNLAKAMSEVGEDNTALKHYEQAVKLMPAYQPAWLNFGKILFKSRMLNESLICFEKLIQLNPESSIAHYNRGLVLSELMRLEEALQSYDEAVSIKPDFAEAHHNRGRVLKELKNWKESIKSFKNALTIKPEFSEVHNDLGLVLQELANFDESLASFSKAIEFKTDFAVAYNNRGNVLLELNLLEEALQSYATAIEIMPDYAEAYSNCGVALQKLVRLEESLTFFKKAIELKADYVYAYYNQGVALQAMSRLDAALASYNRAIELKHDYSLAYLNRGVVLHKLSRLSDALHSYNKAIELNPKFSDALNNRGNLLQELGLWEDALHSYEKVFEINPKYEYLLGTLLHTKMHMCKWQNFQNNVESLVSGINAGKKISLSFHALSLIDSVSIHRETSCLYTNDKYPLNLLLGIIPKSNRNNKIRIGYFSADFREHPVSYLVAELFELHDKKKFELIAFYHGPPDTSSMHARLKSSFSEFIDISRINDKEAAKLSRDIGIDIAVDLTGMTKNERVGIFSYRAAPLQVNYLGYSGTMGSEYYDYIIGDETVIQKKYKDQFIEKILYLPNCFLPHDRTQKFSEIPSTKLECNLPLNGFIFSCFNAAYKISPLVFDSWMRILKATNNSILWLSSLNEYAISNLRLEAKNQGVDPNRLIFAERVNLVEEHLTRLKHADLFLDTLPYNAHTTTLDSLWADVPVLTCVGESFASRVSASALMSIGLPELVTTSLEQYEQKAINLANNPSKLKTIKDKLERNRLTTALFDSVSYTNNIEEAYIQIYERYQADLPTDHIFIKSRLQKTNYPIT